MAIKKAKDKKILSRGLAFNKPDGVFTSTLTPEQWISLVEATDYLCACKVISKKEYQEFVRTGTHKIR
jgi:hypothetical protein